MDAFVPSLSRSRIATIVLPSAIAYCSSSKRWFSRAKLNEVDRGTANDDSAAPPRINLQAPTNLGVPSIQSEPYNAITGATPRGGACETGASIEALVPPKKRRLQPICVQDQAASSKQVCTGAADQSGKAGSDMLETYSSAPDRMPHLFSSETQDCAMPLMGACTVSQPSLASAVACNLRQTRVNSHAPAAQQPQPGQGDMEAWMRENPDRPRLPGGGDDVLDDRPLARADHTCDPNLMKPPAPAIARQPWRRKQSKDRGQASSLGKSALSVCALEEGSARSCSSLSYSTCGKENEGPCASLRVPHVSPENIPSSPERFR